MVAPNLALAPGRRDGTLETRWRGSTRCSEWRKGAPTPQGIATPLSFRATLGPDGSARLEVVV